MQRARLGDDSGSWYLVLLPSADDPGDQRLTQQIRWCKLHVSDGRFDHSIGKDTVQFRFQQLEDAQMFRRAWAAKIG